MTHIKQQLVGAAHASGDMGVVGRLGLRGPRMGCRDSIMITAVKRLGLAAGFIALTGFGFTIDAAAQQNF
jgi:hypothetical protein